MAPRLPAAGDAERKRIQQDIHDGVQQHRSALRIRLRLAAEAFHARGDTDASAAMEAFGDDVEGVIDELRDVAQGIYPALLTSSGLSAALASAGRRAGRPVSVRARNVRRCRPEIEIAVYFTCLAAIDNAAKHAGPAQVAVRLSDTGHALRFTVSDSGTGLTGTERRRAPESQTCATASPPSAACSASIPYPDEERAWTAACPTRGRTLRSARWSKRNHPGEWPSVPRDRRSGAPSS